MTDKPAFYALYKGDTYIDQGTVTELARKHHMKEHRIYEIASRYNHRKSKGNALLAYRLEDD